MHRHHYHHHIHHGIPLTQAPVGKSLQLVNIRGGRLPEAEGNGVSYLRIPVDADLKELGRLGSD